jgi:hypothetical protein
MIFMHQRQAVSREARLASPTARARGCRTAWLGTSVDLDHRFSPLARLGHHPFGLP